MGGAGGTSFLHLEWVLKRSTALHSRGCQESEPARAEKQEELVEPPSAMGALNSPVAAAAGRGRVDAPCPCVPGA